MKYEAQLNYCFHNRCFDVRIIDSKHLLQDMLGVLQIGKIECVKELKKRNGKLGCICLYKNQAYYGALFDDSKDARKFIKEFINPRIVMKELIKCNGQNME